MPRKILKSYAHGVADSFAASAEHFAWLALASGEPRVEIDLLGLSIGPALFDIERNRILAGRCRDILLKNARSLAPPRAVVGARLVAEFGIGVRHGRYIGPSTFTVVLRDDRGRDWPGVVRKDRQLVCP